MMRPAVSRTHTLLHAPRAALRQRLAASWVAAHGGSERVLVLTPSPEAGSRVLRLAAEGRAAAFGWQRLTPGELAARLAAGPLAAKGRAPAARVVFEAVCARMVHSLQQDGQLGRYARVGDRPGLPRALARTFAELRLGAVESDDPALPTDLGVLYRAYGRELERAGLADRALVLRAAIDRARDPAPHPLLDAPVVLFDLGVPSALDEELLGALAARSSVRAIVPSGDSAALRRLSRALGVTPAPADEPAAESAAESERDAGPGSALERLSNQLFSEIRAAAPPDETVELFSAPGESRECVEIARRVLRAADEGVPFDRIAVLTHAPDRYRAHLVEAFRRAGIPACFSRGTVRPDPAGRALLALLACAEEGLSARAFAEYLSLGVVPDAAEDGAPPDSVEVPWLAPEDELSPTPAVALEGALPPEEQESPVDPDAPVVRGTLRAPWRWERLLVDAAVIGGADRWRRRLAGLERGLERSRAALESEEDEVRAASLDRARRDLSHLRAFALPLIDALDALPSQATWGEWAQELTALAARAIRDPARVHAILRELSPMGPIGPVGLTEVQLVLARRLTEMVDAPSGAPAGRLYVASTDEVRGLSFRRVFVPGLAERVFPRKVTEDPIALDAVRARLSSSTGPAELVTTQERVEQERLALRLAIGAAEERLVLSYPRLDTERGRPRVPSFYGLEVLRAVEGALPSFEQLASRAEASGGSRMAWPAPEDPAEAIDGAEYDLAVLQDLLHISDDAEAAGAARYLVEANEHLARALRARYARWAKKWTKADGLVNASEEAVAALSPHRLDQRAYSATALEQLAWCPYRFYLRAVLKLSPRDEAEPLEELDPISRGRLVHAVQFALLGRLKSEGMLPVTDARLERARALLDEVFAEVEGHFFEELAPAIERVWKDAAADAKTDLVEWLLRASERPDWVPVGFELGFGLPKSAERDPASTEEPVRLAEGILLRGAIDLVEQRDGALRATDHKTGAARAPFGAVGGGKVLQPVLYALALEALYPGREVVGGRLYYCTAKGGFAERPVVLDAQARDSVRVLRDAADAYIEKGFLPAAPDEGACERCDYRVVCGPNEERRLRGKEKIAQLGLLKKLRKQP